MEKRTDLALEVRESFPEDDIEVSGVVLEEETYLDGRIRKSTVEIKNERGQRQMHKPIGNYITLEFTDKGKYDDPEEREKTRKTAAAMRKIPLRVRLFFIIKFLSVIFRIHFLCFRPTDHEPHANGSAFAEKACNKGGKHILFSDCFEN